MTLPELQQVSAWLADTDIGLFELRTAHGHVRLRRDPGQVGFVDASATMDDAASAPVTAAPPALHAVTAPSVGIFLHRHPLRTTPLAAPGTAVRVGQVVGLLQIGALLLPVAAPRVGVVTSVLVADGSPVGYGAPLLELQPPLPASSPL